MQRWTICTRSAGRAVARHPARAQGTNDGVGMIGDVLVVEEIEGRLH
jgi:hypothetical protein